MNHYRKRKRHPFSLQKKAKKTGEFVLQSKRRISWGSLCQMFFHRIERGRSPKCWLPTHSRLRWTWLCESIWRKSLHLWDENCWTEENPRNHSISVLFLLLGFGRVGYPAPRFTWSRNRSTAALSGRGPNKDPGFLKKNLSFSRDIVSFREGKCTKKDVYCKICLLWVGLNKKNTVVTGCLMMDLF